MMKEYQVSFEYPRTEFNLLHQTVADIAPNIERSQEA